MEIQLAYYPQTLLLVFSRLVAITGATVVFGKELAPLQVRVLVAFAIGMVMTPLVPVEWAQMAAGLDTLPKLAFAMLGETLFGVAIALVCELFVGIFMMAGHIAGWASSLSMSQTFDPISGVENNELGLLMQLVFLMLIWCHGGHLILIEIIHKSFHTVPPTMAWLNHDVTEIMMALGAMMYDWGVRLAAPVMAAALVLSAAMGLIAKMAPEFNVLFLSLPIRLFVGFMMMGFFLRFGGTQMRDVIKTMFEYCMRLAA